MITADGNVVHDVVFRHPLEKVWAAVVDRDKISKWLMVTDFEPEVGRPFHLDADPPRGVIDATVIVVEPPRRLVCEWLLNGVATTVTITLETEGDGTRLHLEHTNIPRDQAPNFDSGWPEKFVDLDALLA